MFISEGNIENAIQAHGAPREMSFPEYEMKGFEFDMLRGSGRNGRRHDVTVFIKRLEGYVCIQKPNYRGSGIYRAPSGGAEPGELITRAAVREMKEETGLDVTLMGFPLITRVTFRGPGGEVEPWTSYVFEAEGAGELVTNDPQEICEVKIVTAGEMTGRIADIMINSGWGGFRYRADLTRTVMEIMNSGGR